MTELKKVFVRAAATIVILLALAIIIPNVQRSQISDGGNPGAATLRTINTSEVTYATNYEKIGFAPHLSVLGPADKGDCGPEHACLLEPAVACLEGNDQGWCVKGAYRFNLQSTSTEPPYRDYWATATPIRPYPNSMNFCSGSDAVIRMERAAPLARPYTLDECLALKPAQ